MSGNIEAISAHLTGNIDIKAQSLAVFCAADEGAEMVIRAGTREIFDDLVRAIGRNRCDQLRPVDSPVVGSKLPARNSTRASSLNAGAVLNWHYPTTLDPVCNSCLTKPYRFGKCSLATGN